MQVLEDRLNTVPVYSAEYVNTKKQIEQLEPIWDKITKSFLDTRAKKKEQELYRNPISQYFVYEDQSKKFINEVLAPLEFNAE
jgi:hypothetical protein